MPRPEKQKDNPEIKAESELYKILIGLNKHNDKAIWLVSELEKVPEKSKNLEFCQAYTILLFQKNIEDENDREFMLAACGLLKGFEFKSREFSKRMQRYQKHAKYYNDFFKGKISAGSIGGMCRKEMLRIAGELEIKLTTKLEKNDGRLGLINDVPKELKFPEPRQIPDIKLDIDDIDISTKIKKLIFDFSNPAKVVITKSIPNAGKEVINIASDNITEITIIMSILIIVAIGWFWNDSNQSDHALEELAKNGKYQQEEVVEKKPQKIKGVQSPQIEMSVINDDITSPY